MGKTEVGITAAVEIAARAAGSRSRAQYIAKVSESGGLKLANEQGQVVGFCCLDAGDPEMFFRKSD